MLSLSSILSQLNTMQQLIVERNLQQQVSFNSNSLLVFNCLMLGQKKKEIIKECMLNEKNYPKYERPIYNCILDLFDIKAASARDNFMSEVHYAIYEENHENNSKKSKALENLFHQMKRYSIEQESAPLLKELSILNQGSPLYAVYQHLYKKYAFIAKTNEEIFEVLGDLNNKLSDYLGDNKLELTTKDLIKDFKTIRSLHLKAENKTSETVLKFSMLLLASYCNQKQLLLEEDITLEALFANCRKQIQELPFGIERYFLNNIYHQTTKYAVEDLAVQLDSEAILFSIEDLNTEAPNFAFNVKEIRNEVKESRKNIVINKFIKKFTAFSIPQDSFSIRPNQI